MNVDQASLGGREKSGEGKSHLRYHEIAPKLPQFCTAAKNLERIAGGVKKRKADDIQSISPPPAAVPTKKQATTGRVARPTATLRPKPLEMNISYDSGPETNSDSPSPHPSSDGHSAFAAAMTHPLQIEKKTDAGQTNVAPKELFPRISSRAPTPVSDRIEKWATIKNPRHDTLLDQRGNYHFFFYPTRHETHT